MMKLFERNNSGIDFKRIVLMAGALFITVTSFNTIYADGYKGGVFQQKSKCTFKCTPNGFGGTVCEFVPAGCNDSSTLGIPNARIEQLINPKVVNPKLVNPKIRTVPNPKALK